MALWAGLCKPGPRLIPVLPRLRLSAAGRAGLSGVTPGGRGWERGGVKAGSDSGHRLRTSQH